MSDSVDDKNLLYKKFIHDEARNSSLILSLLAVVLFPIFSILDFYTHKDQFLELSIIRFTTSFLFLISYFYLKRGPGFKRPFLSSSVLLAIASLSITLMCMVLSGSESPYYAGVNLVVLAGVLILPTAVHAGLTAIFVIGIYVLGMLIRHNFDFPEPWSMVNNLFFLVATAIIGTTASWVKDRIRKESFFRNLEITRSMEVLQKELKSSHGNIESLASEIVKKTGDVQNSLELRDSFISMASHELRTPLTAMKLQMEIGRRKIADTSTVHHMQELIESADSQLSRMIRIVDEMLDVSRIQSGKFVIEKSVNNFSELLAKIIERSFLLQIEKGIIKVKIGNPVIQAKLDPFKIEQVIVNLINNALKYGGNTEITVSLFTEQDFAILQVSDKGPGIDKVDQEKIFEKYERGKVGKSGGLGLGLYISKEIIQAHAGSIHLESRPHMDTTFTVRLPIDDL